MKEKPEVRLERYQEASSIRFKNTRISAIKVDGGYHLNFRKVVDDPEARRVIHDILKGKVSDLTIFVSNIGAEALSVAIQDIIHRKP